MPSIMENKKIIQLPDTQSEVKSLESVLAMQGYGLQKLKPVQTIRLIDVFFIAPVLIYASNKVENNFLKISLYGIGLATLIYNGYNYIYYNEKIKNTQ